MATQRAPAAARRTDEDRALKAAHRAMWAAGDYHTFASSTVWSLGPVLVRACRVAAGHKVLDVAAGTGNVAIRAAAAGADVVASDLTPEHFEAGRRAARAEGVDLEWIEGDAEGLPFEDGAFDVVTSCLGAIFAPNHQAVADEMVRVCRPGGTMGLIAFAPEGAAAAFFDVLGPYAPPPPPGAQSPLLWGDDAHVRALFGDRLASLEITPGEYRERAESVDAYRALFMDTFGPMVAIRAALADRPERVAAFDRDFRAFIERSNRAAPGGPVEIPYPYKVIVARRRG